MWNENIYRKETSQENKNIGIFDKKNKGFLSNEFIFCLIRLAYKKKNNISIRGPKSYS